MEQVGLLKDKGIRVIVLNNKGYELVKHWGEAFAKDLTKNQKRQNEYGRTLWHVFTIMYFPVKKGKVLEMHLII